MGEVREEFQANSKDKDPNRLKLAAPEAERRPAWLEHHGQKTVQGATQAGPVTQGSVGSAKQFRVLLSAVRSL